MENKDNITLNPVEKYLNGISKATEVIRSSYGPNGNNVVVHSELPPGHILVNDADSIIQASYLVDPIENKGLDFLKELSAKANRDSGDGRKTTLIIAEEILKGGFKEKIKGMKLKEELDLLLPKILENIDNQSKKVELEDIGMVAQTSSRSKETAEWLSKIYQEIGRDGIIELEGSGTYDTSYKVTDGVKLRAGWLAASMVYDEQAVKEGRPEKQAVYENPIILVSKRKIEKEADIAPLVQRSIDQNKPLVIFASDMDNLLATALINTHRLKKAKILIIRAPILWGNYIFEDFAKCVGATIVEDATGLSFKNLKIEHLGTCEKLICDKEETILRGIKDISGHKEALRQEGSNDSLLRLQWLNTKTALLRLGAGSESELSYKRLKAQDAISACRLALQDGIVPGAASSLLKASFLGFETMPCTQTIFTHALEAPFTQLAINSGESEEIFLSKLENVWDATAVIKSAVKNAVSLAGMVLTTGADIRLKDLTFEDKQLEILYKQRNPFGQ